eukprot:TRINITY_DN37789_c0_g1_i1.p1 TRINITY_DN37789_c0_g1~~TRINITY_DN37789_c0_g1_i1.p1  ORF type:complete len:230 (+),score=27.51 TRINITY_DN37789_c0_g1_i1:132-821(+)
MTNPSGLCQPWVTVNNVYPLFPVGGKLDDRPLRTTIRDRQVYPRAIRETDSQQCLHRTASVKHHLRATAERHEMSTTYEHDFGFCSRPMEKPRSSARTPTHSLSRSRPLAHDGATRTRVLDLARDDAGSSRSGASRRSISSSVPADATLASMTKSFSQPSLWPTTEQKLRTLQRGSDPMELAPRGWHACRWSSKSHPHMISGFSDKRTELVQTANIMNLRAPDVPFTTR